MVAEDFAPSGEEQVDRQAQECVLVTAGRIGSRPLFRRGCTVWADSSRHRNDFGEFFLGHHIVEGFSGSSVEALLDCCEVSG